ncbi:hypothetical protein N657DRAFT_235381 [Parathielavia appendiculata]|uniref:Uncharacterized protein n=1 Tax=Parathielavia appendiculata TaxID=2587402 RepID=A0AAN6U7P1_9PEZI|nr:hypothetical protein N657DRAFT_235381 [Parathielavia appendiculata]
MSLLDRADGSSKDKSDPCTAALTGRWPMSCYSCRAGQAVRLPCRSRSPEHDWAFICQLTVTMSRASMGWHVLDPETIPTRPSQAEATSSLLSAANVLPNRACGGWPRERIETLGVEDTRGISHPSAADMSFRVPVCWPGLPRGRPPLLSHEMAMKNRWIGTMWYESGEPNGLPGIRSPRRGGGMYPSRLNPLFAEEVAILINGTPHSRTTMTGTPGSSVDVRNQGPDKLNEWVGYSRRGPAVMFRFHVVWGDFAEDENSKDRDNRCEMGPAFVSWLLWETGCWHGTVSMPPACSWHDGVSSGAMQLHLSSRVAASRLCKGRPR